VTIPAEQPPIAIAPVAAAIRVIVISRVIGTNANRLRTGHRPYSASNPDYEP
jgi:hypothetical protein